MKLIYILGITNQLNFMKKIIILIVILALDLNVFSQTQMELNNQAKIEYEKADNEKIVQNYKSDTVFIKSMREAQRQWMKFRDAQVNMKYPPYPNSHESVLPMCRYYYLEELTNVRIKDLKLWIEKVEEGDACSGSIKIKGQ